MSLPETFAERGWAVFPADARSHAWAKAARAAARAALADPELRARWLQCEGTWFVGVDAMPNEADGSLGTVPLAGPAVDALAPLPALHRAQLSVVFPGYPRPRDGESEAAFRYRCRRDAAHVDGLIAEGSTRRRRIAEPHAFILGLPLTEAHPGASPLVVWEGSHRIIHAAIVEALAPHRPETWGEVDITEVYQAARRCCFETCPRVPLAMRPGGAVLVHRHALHGIAPWAEGAEADPEGRMIAYFRPQLTGGAAAWMARDGMGV